MPLTFPTLAEQAVADYREGRAPGIQVAAVRIGAWICHSTDNSGRKVITYTFDDDTSIMTKGAGRNYSYATFHP